VIVLSDSAGQVVYSAPGDTEIGKHSFVWDGQDADGNQLPDGNYTIAISARNADNEAIEAPTSIFGQVTGVESTTDGALITIGGVHIPLTDILSVKETVPAA
jgi:flagellar basal-body rod modification protein FlgD